MRAPSILRAVVIVGLASGFAIASISSADAQKVVRWKMQSAWGSSVPHVGTSAVRFIKNVEAMSGGTLKIELFEPRALVPARECFDAVSKGVIESCWTLVGLQSPNIPALAFFAAVPFGGGLGEFLAWKWFGGGNKLKDEIYAKHNLIAFDSFAIGPESSGWFRNEITSVDQLKGLKMRILGLAGKVLKKFGVSTHLLQPSDIYHALERGVLDAAEFSMPSLDITLGFHQIVKNNYHPGWHQPVTVGELLINGDTWNKLSEQHKAIIRVALRENVIHTYAETEAKNFGVMQEMTSKHGVTIQRWPDEILRRFEKAWREVVEEESARDPLFKRVADSYFRFRKQYRLWGDAQFLKSTYLDE
ncbi:MAG: TRAP transporter substrate-binding protein [Acidobacteriota bacterium]